jgi:CRP-like cAMP-binding protein
MFRVKSARTEEERRKLYRFYYTIYAEEQGYRLRKADHAARLLQDELDDDTATMLYAELEGEIVGSLRRTYLAQTPVSASLAGTLRLPQFRAAFPPESLAYTSRFMISARWRRSVVIGKLIEASYRAAAERGIRFDFGHCAPALVPLYERLGYRRYAGNYFDPEKGFRIPLVAVVEDVQHFAAVHSPVYRTAHTYRHNPATAAWFAAEFPAAAFLNTALTTPEKAAALIRGRLDEQAPPDAWVWRDLEDEERAALLRLGYLHPARAGETILRPGELSEAVFLLLSGEIEVSDAAGPNTVVGPGETFGESALFGRPSSREGAVARTDVELAVIPSAGIDRARKRAAAVIGRVLDALSSRLRARGCPGAGRRPERVAV